MFGYIPTDWTDPTGSVGLPTREASRAVEYAVGDFAVRQAAIALGKSAADVAKYQNRSMNFVNHWDPNVMSDGFSGFLQRRYPVCVSAVAQLRLSLTRLVGRMVLSL